MIAKDVKRAVLLVNTIPMFGLNIDIVEMAIPKTDPKNLSVIFNATFFSFNFYISSYNNDFQF